MGQCLDQIISREQSGLNGLVCLFEPLTNQRRDFVKDFGAVNRHFAENLAIQLDVSQRKSIDESGIRQATHFSGRLDSDDPQGAEFTLAVPSVAVRENAVSHDGLFDETQQVLSAAVAALHFTKQSLMGLTTCDAKRNSHDDIR